MPTLEEIAPQNIDALLARWRGLIQDRKNLHNSIGNGIAVRKDRLIRVRHSILQKAFSAAV